MTLTGPASVSGFAKLMIGILPTAVDPKRQTVAALYRRQIVDHIDLPLLVSRILALLAISWTQKA